jgi:hypothetical protein
MTERPVDNELRMAIIKILLKDFGSLSELNEIKDINSTIE